MNSNAAPTSDGVLKGSNLGKTYGRKSVVRGVSLEVHKGEVVGLLGPNGAGKTTTFYMLTGMIRPTSGTVTLGGTDITAMPMYQRARMGLGYLSQEPSVFTRLSVEDNLRLVLQMSGLTADEQSERLELLLHDLHILHIRKSSATTLSGGERRRTEIARSLVMDPQFILLDEPFAGIDPIAVEEIQRIIVDLRARGIGVLITDHNVRETLSITDRAYLLYNGELMKTGTAEELAEDEETRRLYLGKNFKLDSPKR
ncbi:MAG: LPS export ABC transporter ATP-binding protein [Candidatus Marinimicrobia bacterium]|nr:LPS export ABC transporter ATP-binding protein [Candidatus Neomarinimicrobiota bacterium]